MVGKILKWGCLSVLFTHEKQRKIRCQEADSSRHFQRFARNQRAESFSPCAVSDLIVVLREDDKLGHWAFDRGTPMVSAPEAGSLPRIDKAFPQCRGQLVKPSEVLVITCPLSREQRMQGMVDVVVPLSIQAIASFGKWGYDSHIVQVALSNHMNEPAQPMGLGVHGFGQFTHNVTGARVEDAMDGI